MKDKLFFVGIAGIILVLILMLGCWYTVNQGERALVLRLGRIVDTTGPGLRFKLPIVDSIEKISVRTRKIVSATEVYSKDIQGAKIELSINYSLNPANVADIYTKYSTDYEPRVMIPQIMAKLKDVFGQYNAVEIVRARERIAIKIAEDLQKQFIDTGIQVETVQVENIDFSKEYEKSVEERMKAEVEVEKVRQNLEREKLNAEMVRTAAQGAADAKVMAAEADSKAIKLRGDAEAHAIRAKADALAKNAALVDLIQAERWDGKLPSTMLPSGIVPIIGVKNGNIN